MSNSTSSPVITSEQLLKHWQGHRSLTRRVIEAFPEKDLFNYSIGGMRTFSQLVLEFVGMATPTLVGITTRTWPEGGTTEAPTTKEEMIQLWDKTTSEIDRLWPEIPPDRFQETDKAFGQWEMPVYGLISYIIDNEIHQRGQGYVYLRSLGVEPPPFYVRE
jgi:uncharacterized damage-inducible protein DinB